MDLQLIQNKIYEIRGQRVMLDFDLANLYGVETRVLNQTIKRNLRRFPADFMFQLAKPEFNNLMSQIVISSWAVPGNCRMRLQNMVLPCWQVFFEAIPLLT